MHIHSFLNYSHFSQRAHLRDLDLGVVVECLFVLLLQSKKCQDDARTIFFVLIMNTRWRIYIYILRTGRYYCESASRES